MLRPALALGVLLLAAGPVSAGLTLTMETSGGPIEPATEVRAVEAVLTIDCTTLLARTVSAPAPVTLTFTAPSTVLVTGSTGAMFEAADCPPGAEAATVRLPYQVTVTRDAPGLVDLAVRVDARLESHPSDTAVGGTPQASAEFTVAAAPFLFSEVQAQAKLKLCGCPVTFDVDVTNFGNVRTLYSFELVTAPSFEGGGEAAQAVVLPEPFELAPSNAGSTSTGTAKLVFQPPDSWSGEGVLTVSVLSSAVGDPSSTGEPRMVSVLARRPDPLDKATPAVDPSFVVLALAAVAVVFARRRA